MESMLTPVQATHIVHELHKHQNLHLEQNPHLYRDNFKDTDDEEVTPEGGDFKVDYTEEPIPTIVDPLDDEEEMIVRFKVPKDNFASSDDSDTDVVVLPKAMKYRVPTPPDSSDETSIASFGGKTKFTKPAKDNELLGFTVDSDDEELPKLVKPKVVMNRKIL